MPVNVPVRHFQFTGNRILAVAALILTLVNVLIGNWKTAHVGKEFPEKWWHDRPIVVWLAERHESEVAALEKNEKERKRLNDGRAEKAKLDAEFEEKQKTKTQRRAPRLPATAEAEPAGGTEKTK